jgi:hypothetical protein
MSSWVVVIPTSTNLNSHASTESCSHYINNINDFFGAIHQGAGKKVKEYRMAEAEVEAEAEAEAEAEVEAEAEIGGEEEKLEQ